jgi:hypothetical protein
MAREGHFYSRGFTAILVALPPLNNDNSLKIKNKTLFNELGLRIKNGFDL